MKLKVMSYNIHKGFDWRGGAFTLARIRDAIRHVNADLVFLQEVVGEHKSHSRVQKEWPSQTQFEFLADSIWPHYAYAQNAVYSDGHHGNAILSKYPIVKWDNEDISTNPFEHRGMLHCEVEIPQKGICHAFCVHLNLFQGGRTKQYDLLASRIARHTTANEPLVLAGDFNDWNQKAGLKLERDVGLHEVFLKTTGTYAATFPVLYPLLRLDRIYVRHFEIEEVHRHHKDFFKTISDHAALSCTVKLLASMS